MLKTIINGLITTPEQSSTRNKDYKVSLRLLNSLVSASTSFC